MTILKIKLEDSVEALDTRLDAVNGEAFFLNTETGAVLLYTEDMDNMPKDLENNSRYRIINPTSPHKSFEFMDDFVDSLGDTKEARLLKDALNRPKPFRQLNDTLCDQTDQRYAWFAFKKEKLALLAEKWCKYNGIKAECI